MSCILTLRASVAPTYNEAVTVGCKNLTLFGETYRFHCGREGNGGVQLDHDDIIGFEHPCRILWVDNPLLNAPNETCSCNRTQGGVHLHPVVKEVGLQGRCIIVLKDRKKVLLCISVIVHGSLRARDALRHPFRVFLYT